MAPFTPHISEEIYQVFYPETDKFIVNSEWPVAYAEWYNPKAVLKAGYLREIIDAIREWKAKNKLSMKAEVPKIVVNVGKNELGAEIMIDDILEEVKHTGHVKEIEINKISEKGVSVTIQ